MPLLPMPRDLCAFNKLVFILASSKLKVSYLHEELADVLALVTLQLNHFSILGVLNYSTIAGKFLQQRHKNFISTTLTLLLGVAAAPSSAEAPPS